MASKKEIHGILLVDKPAGISSHTVVSRIRKKFGGKVGHAGTLDPLATGLLLVCMGKATKISSYITAENKVYEFEMLLGTSTDTYDSDGEVVEQKPIPRLLPADLTQMLKARVGTQMQKPPMYSAIKIQGKKLYQLARAGKEVEVPSREIQIFSLELLSLDLPRARIRIGCSKGTYVRSFAHDLGQEIGCGATVTAIRRVQSGEMSVAMALPLEKVLELDTADLEPRVVSIKTALESSFFQIRVSPDEERKMIQGAGFERDVRDVLPKQSPTNVLFVSEEGREVAIGALIDSSSSMEIKRVF